MKTTKINVGLAISRNFNKVTLDIIDEAIEHNSDEEFKAKVRQKFNLLRTEVDLEFEKMNRQDKDG